MKKIWLVLAILFFGLCVMFVIFGVFASSNLGHLNEVCTEETTAIVTNLEEKMVRTQLNDRRKELRIFEKISYTVDGKTYTKDRSITTGTDQVGDALTIRYNPGNPEEFIEVNETAEGIFSYVFYGLAGVMGILGVVSWLLRGRKQRTKKNRLKCRRPGGVPWNPPGRFTQRRKRQNASWFLFMGIDSF